MGKGKWDRQRVKRHSEGGEEEEEEEIEEGSVALHRETVPSLDTAKSWCWKMLEKKCTLAANASSFLLISLQARFWRFLGGRGREITMVSYNGRSGAESSKRLNGNESTPSLFLIDQSLSKAKARVGGWAGGATNTPEVLIWNRHFREQIRLSNYHLCLRMTPLMWMWLQRLFPALCK